MNRRRFLQTTAAAGLAVPFSPEVQAAISDSDKHFIFVFAQGGWDATRVFATEFGNNNVDMERGAELATVGGLTYADHGQRPSVRAFMEAYHDRTVILNGLLVRSIAHEICTMLAMTGGTSGLQPDWPAVLGDAWSGSHTLPHLVLAGPSFPGDRVGAVARAGSNGQLEALLSGRSSAGPISG